MASKEKKTPGKIKVKNDKTNPDEELKQEIADRIRGARLARRYSVRHVAESIGISREALNQIELGKNHVNAVMLYKIATRLECKLEYFFPPVDGEYALGPKGRTLIVQANPDSLPWIEGMFKKDT